jgi:hypothetical protein
MNETSAKKRPAARSEKDVWEHGLPRSRVLEAKLNFVF